MKFFLGRDESCHWFLIPAGKREEWEKFREIPEEDPKSWDVPKWAKMIDGPHRLEFENPVEI